jgi:hypothetical protein
VNRTDRELKFLDNIEKELEILRNRRRELGLLEDKELSSASKKNIFSSFKSPDNKNIIKIPKNSELSEKTLNKYGS